MCPCSWSIIETDTSEIFLNDWKKNRNWKMLFQFLFKIDKIFCIKKISNTDVQTITYFFDRNDTSIKAFAIGDTFDCALRDARFVTERIGGDSPFFTQIIDS